MVYRDEVCELLQYAPSTPHVASTPVVAIPPQINKYYFLDLAPGRSFIEHAVAQGIPVFAISWRNPSTPQRHWDLDTYAAAVIRAIDVARDVTRNRVLDEILSFFGGKAAPLMAQLADAGKLTPDDVQELERTIRKLKARRKEESK